MGRSFDIDVQAKVERAHAAQFLSLQFRLREQRLRRSKKKQTRGFAVSPWLAEELASLCRHTHVSRPSGNHPRLPLASLIYVAASRILDCHNWVFWSDRRQNPNCRSIRGSLVLFYHDLHCPRFASLQDQARQARTIRCRCSSRLSCWSALVTVILVLFLGEAAKG